MGSLWKWTVAGLLLGAVLMSRACATLSSDPHPWVRVRSLGPCAPESVPWTLRRLRGLPWTELARRARAETGVSIGFDCPEGHEVALGWHNDWESLPEELRSQAVLHAWHQLRAYDADVLEKTVQQVVLVGDLKTEGGTHIHGFASTGTGIAFVHRSGLVAGTTLHHEIGHLLEATAVRPVDRAAWYRARPLGFVYSHPEDRDGRLDRRERASRPREGWLESGFVNDYSSTAFEEDFANLLAWEMACPSTLGEAAEAHPLLGEKRDLLHAMLRRIGLDRGD